MAKKILVLQRGWVVVGDVVEPEPVVSAEDGLLVSEPAEVVLENASVIRRWGTSKGIGQLALEGPKSGTVLDAAGTVRVHPLAVVLTIDVDDAKWA